MNTCSYFGEHMYLNKSTTKVLKFFVSYITESFTLREIARKLGMHVSQAHRSIKPLIDNKLIGYDKHKNLSLNYKMHHGNLIFAEYLRRDDFLGRYKEIRLFSDQIITKIRQDSFILLVFGSAVESTKPRDIDILMVLDSNDKIAFHEKFLHNISSGYSLPFEASVLSFESVYEMLSKRDEKNVFNELLNKHIILYGAELFYRLVKRGR